MTYSQLKLNATIFFDQPVNALEYQILNDTTSVDHSKKVFFLPKITNRIRKKRIHAEKSLASFSWFVVFTFEK